MTYAAPVSLLAVELIGLYQRWISPVKGFCCALRQRRPRCQSCSQFGRRVIERFGLLPGVRLIRRRFDKCRHAGLVLDYESKREQPRRKEQPRRTWADCAPGCDLPAGACDAASAIDGVGGCDAGCCDLSL